MPSSPIDNPHKTRLTTLIGEKVGTTAPPTRSQRILQAIANFNTMRTRMRSLVVSVRAHHTSMLKTLSTRANLVECLEHMSLGGQMESHVKGDKNNPGLTYVSIHKNMAERATGYMQKYEEFIINYAVEWERVLTERVSEDIKRVDNHKRDLDHYLKKVESLRAANDKNLAKGKIAKGEEIDRLERNEKKLRAAERDYSTTSEDLLLLIDEVVGRGWKDLMPLMIKVAQFDATYASDEATQLSSLNDLAVAMKSTGDLYHVPSKPRLRALRLDSPADITTGQSDSQYASLIAEKLAIADDPSRASSGGVPQSVSLARSESPDYSVPDDEKTQNISPITHASEADYHPAPSPDKVAPVFPSIPEDEPHVQDFKSKTYASGRDHSVVMSDASVSGNVEVSVSDEYSLASAIQRADAKASAVSNPPKQSTNDHDDEKSEMAEFVNERKTTNPFE